MVVNKIVVDRITEILSLKEKCNTKQNECISLLELLRWCKEFYNFKQEFMCYAHKYFKDNSNFRLFYFDDFGNTIIHLGYDSKTNIKRELILTYKDDIIEIVNKEILTEEEIENIYSNIEFYEQLVIFGTLKNNLDKKISTVSNDFNVDLSNRCLKVEYNNCKKYMCINYMFSQDIIEDRINSFKLTNEHFYNTDEGLILIDTNVLRLRKILTENHNENIIKLLDNLYVYVDMLPCAFSNSKINKKILTK